MTTRPQPVTTAPGRADLTGLLGRATPAAAAAEILRVLETEEALAADNRLAPYAGVLPLALASVPPRRLAVTLDALGPPAACRALFGGFRTLPAPFVLEIFQAGGPTFVGRMIDEMAVGADLPARAARLLATMRARRAAHALLVAGAQPAARVASLLAPERLAAMLATLELEAAAAWLACARAGAAPAETGPLLDAVRLLSPATRQAVLSYASPRRPEVEEDLARGVDPAWDAIPLPELVLWMEKAPTADAAVALRTMAAYRQRALLWHMAPGAAARTLTTLARTLPAQAGNLLGALADLILVRDADGALRRVLRHPRGAAVLSWLDTTAPAVAALLRHVDPGILAGFLAHGDADARLFRSRPSYRPARPAPPTYPACLATGARRGRSLGGPLRWSRLTETVSVEGRAQPLRVDLLEVDLAGARMQACGASTEGRGVAFADMGALLGPVCRSSPPPGDRIFRRLGTVRVTEAVAAQQCLAGINGGFYLDYGHYLDTLDLGLDLAQPGLRFGNVIGWFVSGGRELAPAVFNRAALVLTTEGRAHVRRVGPVSVGLPNGQVLRWRRRPGQPAPEADFLDQLTGPVTPTRSDRVDVVVSGTTITGIRTGGGSPVPLLGFVLSLPRAGAASLLRGVVVGDPVVIGNDFPAALGPVEEAMACGPLLVRDGQVDLDLDAEGFGEKDSTVLPLSLTRDIDSLHAARSFVVLRSGRLVLGVVSGTRLGGGPPTVSVGATFGELAQLCVDLGAEHAMALDGGGSSSLVGRVDGQPRLINVPTGGSDAPVGVERFVKTYWLVRDTKEAAR